MQKKFLANLFITLITNLVVKPFWIFGIDRTIQNRVGVEQYGSYASLFAFSLLLSVLLDLGINNYNASSLARNPHKLNQQFAPLLFIKLAFGALYILITFLSGKLYGFSASEQWLLVVLSLNQLFAYLSTYFRSTLTGLQKYRTDAWISVTDRLVMSVGGVALLLFTWLPVSVASFIYIQTIGYLAAVAVSFLALLPDLHGLSFSFSISRIMLVLKKAMPFAMLALLMMLYSRTDVLLLKKIAEHGDTENGIYAQGVRLVDASNMFAVMISGLLLPMFASLISKRSDQLLSLVKLGMFVMLIPVLFAVIFGVWYAPQLMELLYHQVSSYSFLVFRLVLCSIIPMSIIYVFGTLLTAAANMRLLIITSAVALVINMMVNIVLIPLYGASGAAMVSLLTNCFVSIVYIYMAITRLELKLNAGYLFKYVWFALFCFVAMWILSLLSWEMPAAFACYSLAAVAVVLMLRLVSIAQIRKEIAGYTQK